MCVVDSITSLMVQSGLGLMGQRMGQRRQWCNIGGNPMHELEMVLEG
jgi:hypothetical protein